MFRHMKVIRKGKSYKTKWWSDIHSSQYYWMSVAISANASSLPMATPYFQRSQPSAVIPSRPKGNASNVWFYSKCSEYSAKKIERLQGTGLRVSKIQIPKQ